MAHSCQNGMSLKFGHQIFAFQYDISKNIQYEILAALRNGGIYEWKFNEV